MKKPNFEEAADAMLEDAGEAHACAETQGERDEATRRADLSEAIRTIGGATADEKKLVAALIIESLR